MWQALLPLLQSQGGKAGLGALLGAFGGSREKEPLAYEMAPQLTEFPYRQGYTRRQLDFLDAMATGSKPLMSQGEITRQLSGSRGRLDADFAAGAQRIAERNIGRQGRMGGMAEASLAELERQRLGEGRQLEAGVQNALAAQAPEMRMQAAKAGLGFMQDEQGQYINELHNKWKQDALRAGFSKTDNILGGALGGFSKMGGMDWLNSLGNKGGFSGAPSSLTDIRQMPPGMTPDFISKDRAKLNGRRIEQPIYGL